MCWSLFLIKLQAWIIESSSWITRAPWFHVRNHTQSNQLIRKHATYLVKKHLNVHSNYYNVSFLIEKSFWNLSSLLHNLTYLSLLHSFLLLVLSTFPIFLNSLNNYFFRWLAYKSLLAEFWCYNELYYVVFQSFFVFCIQLFPTFFMSWVFQRPGFSGSGSGVQVRGLGPVFRSRRCKATLLKSHFCMVVLPYMCYIFSELKIIRVSQKINSRGLLLIMEL